MIKSYLTTAIRNFQRHKSFTFLNILGLSLGLASGLLILQYVKYEKSFDTFHTKAKNIYRIQYNVYQNNKLNIECAAAVPAVGPALKNNFPEIRQFTRLFPISGTINYRNQRGENITFREEKMQITDPAVFEVFDFKLMKGNAETSLEGPNKAVISESAARKFFGEEDPMGKFITIDGTRKAEITGVFTNVPDNSHIKFNLLFSYQTLNNETNNASETAWGWYDFNTYVLVDPATEVAALQSKWDTYLQNERSEEWNKYNFKEEFIFQPLLDIHLYSNLLQESEPEEQGDGNAVYFLTIIAFFVVIIAWVNYINLATAKSFERANEVGVRKVMGAKRGQLMHQFLVESFFINLLAMILALVIVALAWPSFSALAGREIPEDFMLRKDFWLLVTGFFLAGSVFSGIYPALVLSSFKPVMVLKGRLVTSKGSILRKILVVFQFVASVFLISGTIIVYQQLSFMQNRDLGIDINQTLVLKGPDVADSLYAQSLESFKNEVLQISGVKQMSAASNVPGDEIFWTRDVQRLQGGPESSITVYNVGIDEDYIPAFDLKVVAGRNLEKRITGDRQRVLLNRELANALAFKDPEKAIGERVRLGGDTLEIAGVLENYHQMSLKNKMAPLALRLMPSQGFFSFKIETNNYRQVLENLEKPWNTIFPGNPIDYFFLDDFFNRQYQSDHQFGQVFGLFSALTILIACLGLFGLASFMTIQRTKEIGVRKVLGSTVANIVLLLSKGFIQLVIIANLIAWPATWWVMKNWLDSFPYHIGINPLLFLVAGFGVVIIAFLSVGFQTLKAASLNPAKTLKYE